MGILATLLLIIVVWNVITNDRRPNINLEKYRYERELGDSPCISPDGSSKLKMLVVYNQPVGGQGFILGFVYFKDTDEKKWVYLQKCTLNTSAKTKVFNLHGSCEFYWKDNNIIVIDNHEIEIQNEETYYFDKDNFLQTLVRKNEN